MNHHLVVTFDRMMLLPSKLQLSFKKILVNKVIDMYYSLRYAIKEQKERMSGWDRGMNMVVFMSVIYLRIFEWEEMTSWASNSNLIVQISLVM